MELLVLTGLIIRGSKGWGHMTQNAGTQVKMLLENGLQAENDGVEL